MQVHDAGAAPEFPKDNKPVAEKKAHPIDRLPEMISSGNKIDEKEYVELFGEEGKREYDLSDKEQSREFVNKLREKYSLPLFEENTSNLEILKTLKATKKSLEFGHEIQQQGEIYSRAVLQTIENILGDIDTAELDKGTIRILLAFVAATNEENAVDIQNLMNMLTTKTTDSILKDIESTNIDGKTLDTLASVVNTFKKDDGSIDAEGLKNFLINVAGEGSVANLQEIQTGLQQKGNTEAKAAHVIDQCDPKDVKEGDYGVKGDKTYQYTNGQWEEIQTQ